MNESLNPKIIEILDIFTAGSTQFQQPDDESVIWTLPRDMKTDIAVVLQAAVDSFSLDIPVIKNGVFEFSKLKAPQSKKSRPVIVVTRQSDNAERMGLGELDGHYNANDPRLIANNAAGQPLFAAGASGGAVIHNQGSVVTCDVTIYDLNEMRADQMYLFVKTIMFAAESTFQSLGYTKPPIRTNGSDSASLLDNDGASHFLFERTLTYQGEHLDFIGAIDTLARLIGIHEDLVPDGLASLDVTLS